MSARLDPDLGTWVGIGAGAVLGLWNGTPPAFQFLISLMALDYLTGLIAAAINREISSDVALRGLLRKVAILLAVATCAVADRYGGLPVDLDGAAALFFISQEVISIVENLGRAGVPMPQEIRDALVKLKPGAKSEPMSQPN